MRGSILTRTNKDGTRTHSIKYRAADGRQVKTAIGPCRRDAERALTTALADVDAGRLTSAPSRDLIGDYLDRWLIEHGPVRRGRHPPRLRERTSGYGSSPPSAGAPHRLTTPDVRRFAADLRASGLAPKTTNNTLVVEGGAQPAVKDGLIVTNPAAGVTLPARAPRDGLPPPR